MNTEEEESFSSDDRRLRWSDNFVLNPGRPPRQIFSIEEALEFSNEIGEALLRERRNFNVIISIVTCVLVLIVIVFIIFFVMVFNKAIVF